MTSYPHGDPSWFVQDRFGMFIHWGTYAQGARHEWLKKREKMTTEEYLKYFKTFDPDLYDPREWAALAKEAGMKYFVITTKHHEGFCLWDTAYTDYKAPNTPAGRDLLKPMVEAFREAGLKVGFYYSLIDWHHPEFPVDRIHPQAEDQAFREANKHRDVRKYADYMYNQVEELLTKFGKIDIMWFDFSYPGEDGKGHEDWQSERLIELIRRLQPHILLNNRLDLKNAHDFVTPEQVQPREPMRDEEGNLVVWEACQTFSGSWGYYRDEQTWKSVDLLLRMLIDSVAKGGNMLLNVGPTGRGEFDYRARERLRGMGEWMRTNGRSIYHCGPAPETFPQPTDCRYTYNPKTNRLYVHLFAWPFKHLHLPQMAGKVWYAQFLHDASEVLFRENEDDGYLTLQLPVVQPKITIPTIELFLK